GGGNEADLEPGVRDVGGADGADGQRDAVDGDRALLGDVAGQLLGQRDADDLPVRARHPGQHGPDAVDVALHEVPAQTGVRGDCALQVDRVAGTGGTKAA